MNDFRMVKLEPGRAPEVIVIEDSFEALIALTGGGIEIIEPFDDPVALVGNGLAMLLAMQPNFVLLSSRTGEVSDIVCGIQFLCGIGEDELESLSPEMAEKYVRIFRNADTFTLFSLELPVIPSDRGGCFNDRSSAVDSPF